MLSFQEIPYTTGDMKTDVEQLSEIATRLIGRTHLMDSVDAAKFSLAVDTLVALKADREEAA